MEPSGTGLSYLISRTALGLFLWAGKLALPVAGAALLILITTILKKAPRIARISAVVGLLLAFTIYIPYYVFEARVQALPKIHDITTDTEHPPIFVQVASLRVKGLNSLEYGGPKIAQQQLAAYPEVRPAYLNVNKSAAFSRALEVVKEWDGKL